MDIKKKGFEESHWAVGLDQYQPLPQTSDNIEIANYLEVDLEDLYHDPSSSFVFKYVYLKDWLLVDLHLLEIGYLQRIKMKESIHQWAATLEEFKQENQWDLFFSRVEKKVLIPAFIDLFEQIPDEQKYEIFIDLYVRSESGFDLLLKEKKMLKTLFELRLSSPEWGKRMEKLNEFLDLIYEEKDELILVHKGVSSIDNPITSYSWTLFPRVAEWFADRFGQDGYVIGSLVRREDILDYITDRNEAEVLIDPELFKEEDLRAELFNNADED